MGLGIGAMGTILILWPGSVGRGCLCWGRRRLSTLGLGISRTGMAVLGGFFRSFIPNFVGIWLNWKLNVSHK